MIVMISCIYLLVKLIISIIIINYFDGGEFMDFKQLNAFLTIGRLQSFTKAAQELGYVSQALLLRLNHLKMNLKLNFSNE